MIGWHVKWSSSFRTFQGIVVSEIRNSDLEGDYTCEVYSEDDDEIYPLPHQNDASTCIRVVKPNIEGYLKYCYQKANENLTLTEFVNCLSNIPMKDKAMKDAQNNVLTNIDIVYHKICNPISGTTLSGSCNNDSKKSHESDKNVCNAGLNDAVTATENEKKVTVNNKHADIDNTQANKKEDIENCSVNDDSSSDSDSNNSEDADESSEEEDEDEEEDSDASDDNDSSSESSDETKESFSESFDSEDFGQQSISTIETSGSHDRKHHRRYRNRHATAIIEPVVNLKVYLQDTQETRGFSIPKVSQGHAYIINILKQDYRLSTSPLLTYRDYDGDTITIRGQNDFMYAVQTHKNNTDISSSSVTITNLKDEKQQRMNNSASNKCITIKMYASFDSSDYNNINNNNNNNNNNNTEKNKKNSNMDDTRLPSIANNIKATTTTTITEEGKSSLSSARVHPLNTNTLNSLSNNYHDNNNHNISRSKTTVTNTAQVPTTNSNNNNNNNNTKSMSTAGSTINYISNRPKLSHLLWQRGEIIGTGSFGQVYSGLDLKTGNKLAVKEVYLGGGVSSGNDFNNNLQSGLALPINKKQKTQAKALRQEIKILSKLDHPNIIKYYGTEVIESSIMRIFLELATEGSVKDVLTHFGPLSESIVRRYANDILQGLNYLHSKGVIHRDIKPTNLLVSNGVVKVADFGCSSMNFETFLTTDNGHDTVAGTTVYMSPEVMKAEKPGGGSSSAFSSPIKRTRYKKRGSDIGRVENTHDDDDDDDDCNKDKAKLFAPLTSVSASVTSVRISPRQQSQTLSTQHQQCSQDPAAAIVLPAIHSNSYKNQLHQQPLPSRILLAPIQKLSTTDSSSSSSSSKTIATTTTNNNNVEMMNNVEEEDNAVEVMCNTKDHNHHHHHHNNDNTNTNEGVNHDNNNDNHNTNTTGGYGRKADIWSLGITLVELSTGKSPFRSAASAIYAVCVTKEFPVFPRHFSSQAMGFLSRCLVENPRERADCMELLQHPFVSSVVSRSAKSNLSNKAVNNNNDDNNYTTTNNDHLNNMCSSSNEYCLFSSSLEEDAKPTSSSLKHTLSPTDRDHEYNGARNGRNTTAAAASHMSRYNNSSNGTNYHASTFADNHENDDDDDDEASLDFRNQFPSYHTLTGGSGMSGRQYGTRSTLEFAPATPLTTGRQPTNGRSYENDNDNADNNSNSNNNNRYADNRNIDDDDVDDVDDTIMTAASLLSSSSSPSSCFSCKQRLQFSKLPSLQYQQQRPASTPYPQHSLSPRALQLQSLSHTYRASVDIGTLERSSLNGWKNDSLSHRSTDPHHHHPRHNSMFVSTTVPTAPSSSSFASPSPSLSLSSSYVCSSRATTAATTFPMQQPSSSRDAFSHTHTDSMSGTGNSVNNRYALNSNHYDDSDDDDDDDDDMAGHYDNSKNNHTAETTKAALVIDISRNNSKAISARENKNAATTMAAAVGVGVNSEPSVGESFDFDRYFH